VSPGSIGWTNFTCGNRSAPKRSVGGFDRDQYLLEHDDAGHDRAAGKVSRKAGMVAGNGKLHGALGPDGCKA
jgi:hypothetical protein